MTERVPKEAGKVGSVGGRAGWTFLAFVFSLTAIAYLDRVCISAAKPAIREALGLSDSEMGWAFSAFTFAYALFEVPSGWLVDRFGPRLMITRIVIFWSLMTAMTGAASGFVSLMVIRLLFGLGEAGMFPGLARAFSAWIPPERHAAVFGWAITAALLSGALTQRAVISLMEWMSWRWAFPLFGAIGLVWAIAWFLWFRDEPPRRDRLEETVVMQQDVLSRSHRVPWRSLWRNRSLRALCVVYFGIIYGWYFYLTWMPDYLRRVHGFGAERAGWFSGLPLLCMALAVTAGGLYGDRLCARRGLVEGRRAMGAWSLPLAALLVSAAVFAGRGEVAAVLMSVAAGLASLSVASAWAVTLDLGGPHSGVVSGAMNMFGNLGGALSPLFVGYSVQLWAADGKRLGWDLPLYSMALMYGLSAWAWRMIDASDDGIRRGDR